LYPEFKPKKVKLTEIIKITQARLVAGSTKENHELEKAFSSDLMSDVLTLDEDHILLVTGLTNIQIIRTAEMADIEVVLLARDKKATPEMIELANENGLVLLETPFSIYRASGELYKNGLASVY
jgi:hypothetical protein